MSAVAVCRAWARRVFNAWRPLVPPRHHRKPVKLESAFLEAGASRGWVGGAKVRRYCEREGLMRSGEGGPGGKHG